MPEVSGDHLVVRNYKTDSAAAEIHQKTTGAVTVDALVVRQWGTSGNGRALVVQSDNTSVPVFTVDAATGGEAQRFNGSVVVSAVASAPLPSTLPLGSTSAARNTGIQLVGSFAGGEDNSGGTDSTPRINIYSYQRAATHSFGEIQRMWLMRQDSKAMLAWYGPQLTGTQNHGYDGNRDALTTGVSWKPWAWLGAHYEANDHASTHGHISIEVPDATGALQTRFEILFADRTTGAIGLNKSFIITNDSDFAVRQSAGESFRVVAPAGTEKRIEFMSDAFGDSTTRRWKLRSTSTAESGTNAGSDFELVRYDDSGVAQSATFLVKRSNGFVGFNAALTDITARVTVRTDGTASGIFSAVSAEGTASVAVNRIETTTTAKRAWDYRLTGDGVSRLRIDSSSSSSGTITFGDGTTADTNLYRSAANTLKTDDKLITAVGLGVGNSAAGSTLGTVTKKIEFFDASGTSLGFVPVYDAIT